MSRTYRRKRGDQTDLKRKFEKDWFGMVESENGYSWRLFYTTQVDKNSKSGRKAKAEFHKDGSKSCWKAPMWFHREFSQKPYKTRCKRALQYYKKYGEDVILESKPHKRYWT